MNGLTKGIRCGSKKGKIAAIASFAATCLCCTVLAVTGIAYPQNAAAMTTADNVRTIGELYNGDGTFNAGNLQSLYKSITGGTATYAAVESKVNGGNVTATAINTANGNKDIVLSFGGEKWTVTYISKDVNGNVIATLWLADGGRSEFIPYSAGWYSKVEKTTAAAEGAAAGTVYYVTEGVYPANYYSASYVRSYLNGTPYIQAQGAVAGSNIVNINEDQSKLSVNELGAQNAKWANFTNGEITEFIVQPKYVEWQQSGLGDSTDFNWTYGGKSADTMNNGLAPASFKCFNDDIAFDYLAKDAQRDERLSYASWGNDFLWLPATTEVANGTEKVGLWQTTENQIKTDNGKSNEQLFGSPDSANLTAGTPTGYASAWLRSGQINDCSRVFSTNFKGEINTNYAFNCRVVRPALHLNLTAAEANREDDYAKIADEWTAAIEKSVSSGTQVKFTLTRNWIAAEHATEGTAFGENGVTGFYNGALFLPKGANILLDLNGFTIDRNLTRADGGVISVAGGAELTVTDSSAKKTGAITGGYTEFAGGGVYVVGTDSTPAKFTFNGGNITGNIAKTGGGIYGENCEITINGGTVSDNRASETGGGIYIKGTETKKSVFKMNGGAVKGNIATVKGGGISLTYTEATFENGVVSYNVTDGESAPHGGGVWAENSDVIFNYVELLWNRSMHGGGACMGPNAKLIMNGGLVADNKATGNSGGIHIISGLNFVMNGGTIKNNTAGSCGGGIYSSSSSFVYLNGGTITGNTADFGGGVSFGTAITAEMKNIIISENTGAYGGGVYVKDTSALTVDGAKIINNDANMAGGGVCVVAEGSVTTVESGEICRNTAKNGGGIAVREKASLTVNGGNVSGNGASGYGGGLHVESGCSLTMGNCLVADNTAASGGAGVYIGIKVDSGGTVRIDGAEICGNAVTGGYGGGGIRVHGDGEITVSNTIISKNKSVAGAVHVNDSVKLTLNNCLISENTLTISEYGGGGIYVQGSPTVVMNDCEVSGNVSPNYGGGIVITGYYSTFTMNGGKVVNNSAVMNGGGISVNSGTATVNFSGGLICDNAGYGGANNLYLVNGAKINVTDKLGGTGKLTWVGVTMAVVGDFTEGYVTNNSGYGARAYFFSDNPSYAVADNSNNGRLIAATSAATELQWQYSADGVNFININEVNVTLPYTGNKYTVRAINKATNQPAVAWLVNDGEANAVGTYAYLMGTEGSYVYSNRALLLEVVATALKWQYATSADGVSWGEWKEFTENTVEYTGLYYNFRAMNGESEVALTKAVGEVKNAGEYSFAAENSAGFYSDTEISFKIEKRYITVSWRFQNANGTAGAYYWNYDGFAHTPSAVLSNLANEQVANLALAYSYLRTQTGITTSAARADAGKYLLTVTLRTPDDNIILSGGTVSYEIIARTVSLGFVNGTAHTAEYDGNGYNVTADIYGLLGVDSGKLEPIITYYENGVALAGAPVNAGEYTAAATLPADGNYIADRVYTATVTITQKEIAPVWTGNGGFFVWVFDGTAKAPSVSVLNPLGSGNLVISREYAQVTGGVAGEYSASLDRVNAGTYSMRVALTNADDIRNYKLTDAVRQFTVDRREVTVEWLDGKGNAVTPDSNGAVIWQYDGEAHTVTPRIYANGVEYNGSTGVLLDSVRTDANKDVALINAAASALTATAALAENDYNKNFIIKGSYTISYQVVKRTLGGASWTDVDGNEYGAGDEIAYPYGKLTGADGPFTAAAAEGVSGNLTLVNIVYSASFAPDTPWAVDSVNGYTATASLSDEDFKNYCFAGGARSAVVKFTVVHSSADKTEVKVVWAVFADGKYPTAAAGTQVTAATRPYTVLEDEGYAFTYNGKIQYPFALRELFGEDGTTYAGYEILSSTRPATADAGSYTAHLLPDGNNYAYAGKTEFAYEVAAKQIKIVWEKASAYYFNGAVQGPVAKVTDDGGNELYVYGEENGNIFGLEVTLFRNAGNHTARAAVNGNYAVTEGETENYTIQKRNIDVNGIKWSVANNQKWTAGEDKSVTASITYENTDKSYSYEIIFVITGAETQVGKHVAYANLDSSIPEHSNYRINGTAQIAYEIVPVSTGTVYWVAENGAAYSSDPIKYVYDGEAHKPSAYYFPEGADTSDPSQRVWLDEYIVTDSTPDAGKRLARLEGDLDFTGAQTVCEFEITPMLLTVEWDEASLTAQFDGAAHSPAVKKLVGANNYELASGTDFTVSSFVHANVYTAQITFLNANYSYADGNTCEFTIEKADVSGSAVWDFGGAEGDETNGYFWRYDAQNHAPALSIDGVTLGGKPVVFTFIHKGVAASAGTHTVTAEIKSAICDGVDYAADYTAGTASQTYEIKPFEITVTWDFGDAQGDEADGYYWVYDGKEHAPAASYADWNGENKTLTVFGAARNASDEKYAARVTLPENCAFAAGETGMREFTIKRAEIAVEWRGDGKSTYDSENKVYYWTYDGEEHAPAAYKAGTNERLEVTGARTDAGEYTALAAQDNANYVITSGGEIKFVINAMKVYVKWYGEDGSESDFDYEYDPTNPFLEHVPTAKLADGNGALIKVNGAEAAVTVRGGASVMGTHTALAEDTFNNYDFADDAETEKQFKISPIDLGGDLYAFEWRVDDPSAVKVEASGNYTVYTYEFNGRAQAPVPYANYNTQFNITINKGTPEAPEGLVQAITEVGEYFITASCADGNYKIPDGQSVIRVVVTGRKVDVEWSEEKLIYNGTAQAPAAYYTDAFGNRVELAVTGSGTNAGDNYKATADFRATTGNYILSEQTTEITFSIEKRTLAVTWEWQAEWSDGHVTYDGLTHAPQPRVSGENVFADDVDKLTVYYEISKGGSVLSDGSGLIKAAKDAGEYVMTLKLGGTATDNYEFESGKGSVKFVIDKKQLTVTAQNAEVNYGSNAPEYTAAFSGLAEVEADAEEARVLASKNLWLACPYTNHTVPGPAEGNNEGYIIGFVETRLNALLPNYDITYVTGVITVKPVQGAVVWEGELPDLGAYYDGEEYKPRAYYYASGNTVVPLTVVYATYADGKYTRNDGAEPAVNAGVYYVMAVAANDTVALTNAETPYTIHKRQITVNIDDKTSVYGERVKILTWKYGTDIRPVEGDDLGITLSSEVNDESTFVGGFKNVGAYLIKGGWNAEAFGANYEVIFSGAAEDGATGENVYGVYEVTEAEITITKAKEVFSEEEFQSIQVINADGVEILLTRVDEKGKPVYIKWAGNQDAEVNILYSRRHNIGTVDELIDPPDPHDRSEEVNRYRSSVDLIRDVGCYAINYIIEIPNHETLYGTWTVLILPESRVVRVEFTGDYVVEYGAGVPEDLAVELLNKGLISLGNISQSDFRLNATAKVVNGTKEVDGGTDVGAYTVEIELADSDENVNRVVSYHSMTGYGEDTNIGRFKIVPKKLDVEWGELECDNDGESHVPAPVITGWVDAAAQTLSDIKVGGPEKTEYTSFIVKDNGKDVSIVVSAKGDFVSAGGHTVRIIVEDGNYEIVADKDIGTVSIKAVNVEVPHEVFPQWLIWLLALAGAGLVILIVVVVVLSRRKPASVEGFDDDGFGEEFDE